MDRLDFDVAHLFAGGLVLVSFMLLYQDRLYALLNMFALQAVVLALSVSWQAYIQHAPHLYITAAITIAFKAIVIPVALHRIVARLGIHRDVENVVSVVPTMLGGIALVALSMVVMLRVTHGADALAREDLAFALSVVLLGLLMMVTRSNAVSQVVGFMSLENGLILAATGAKGMPLVVEISVAFSVLIALIVVGIFLFRIRERFRFGGYSGHGRYSGRRAMNVLIANNLYLILFLPLLTAIALLALPDYRLSARLNVASCFVTFLAALSLFFAKPDSGRYLLIDDLNIVFVVLNTFVAFTTSAFSASYIAHELVTGRLTATQLRFYHAMYQLLLGAMNLALVANNIGLMWVAIEVATLTTVVMVGMYRTHQALEAAWKYFILGSVGIALALFGTILIYMAARPVVGEGLNGMVWTVLIDHVAQFDPALLDLAFVFLLLGYGTKVGLVPLHAWLPDAHAEGPTPISAVLSGLLLNVALYAVLRFKMLMAANPGALAPGPLMATLGLLSIVFAGFMLYRRGDIKRMFAYSSIEHMGIIVFAFGMGGALANFAGLLHMTMHSLTKSAIFFAVGHIVQAKGTQKISDIRGLTVTHPLLGWTLVIGGHGDCRNAAVRRLHERIPDRQFDRRKGAHSRCRHGGRAAGGFWRAGVAACTAWPSGSRAAAWRPSTPPTCRWARILRWSWRPASICRRRWSPGSSTSPSCSAERSAMNEVFAALPSIPIIAPGRGARSMRRCGTRWRNNWRRVKRRCWACGARRAWSTWLCSIKPSVAVASLACAGGCFPSVARPPSARHPSRADHPRPARASKR